ncbi:hypothetical protein C8T65DRAFT_750046 [Cerioporus squamosus]|nr:hypothetical protein C8T65DRAFT_750046 [Cerioporus squamosus]
MARYCRLCKTSFTTRTRFKNHRKLVHARPIPVPPPSHFVPHPHLTAEKCDEHGNFIPADAPPPPRPDDIDWHPFPDRPTFEFAEFAFEDAHLSRAKVDRMLCLFAAKHVADGLPDYNSIFKDYQEILDSVDAIQYGEAPWKTFAVRYSGPVTPASPAWQRETYYVHTRNTLRVAEILAGCPNFNGQFDYVPFAETTPTRGRRVSNLMSGQWAFKQATKIAEDPATHGAMLMPIILGADKTTVSVATGNQEFHPLYMSIGNLHNDVRRSHRDSVIPVAFLAIPTTAHEWKNDEAFRVFKKQLYHASIVRILEPLRAGMTTPHVLRCPDPHFRRAIFELGPFIADYPEQVYLSRIVSGWCPKCFAVPDHVFGPGDSRSCNAMHAAKATYTLHEQWDAFGINSDITPFTEYFLCADIHELLTPDLLHQAIKGVFKDHLVTWVFEYIKDHAASEREAARIIDDIDCRIAAVAPFSGLRCFPQGRNFKQWTGDDSKALMKIFLPAIVGYVPDAMVQCITVFLDFCYLARQPSHDSLSLDVMANLLDQFQALRVVFEEEGVRAEHSFALPRQHSLFHYIRSIKLFGSLNGLCSSITESKHITAVKQPWRESNRRNALGQIIRKNTRLNKLAAARSELGRRNMLYGDVLTYVRLLAGLFADPDESSDEDGEAEDSEDEDDVRFRDLADAAEADEDLADGCVDLSNTPAYVKSVGQMELDPDGPDPDEIDLDMCPYVWAGDRVSVYHCASATFYAPSELCGPCSMHREMIRATPLWWGEYPRYDTVLVKTDPNAIGLDALTVARVRCFFLYKHKDVTHKCALVEWFTLDADEPDPVTGMWVVRPELDHDGA